jgi:hypothetical protein
LVAQTLLQRIGDPLVSRLDRIAIAMGDDNAAPTTTLIGPYDSCDLREVLPVACPVLPLDKYERCAASLDPTRILSQGEDEFPNRGGIVAVLTENQHHDRLRQFS